MNTREHGPTAYAPFFVLLFTGLALISLGVAIAPKEK